MTREEIEQLKAHTLAKKKADAEHAFQTRVTDELDKALRGAAESLSTRVLASIHDRKVEIGLVEIVIPEHMREAAVLEWMKSVYSEGGFETLPYCTESLYTLTILFN